jgi:hypothetical protein
MEEFNLERALAGEPVCTRDGRDVTQLVVFNLKSTDSLYGVLDGELDRWTINGFYYLNKIISEHDLFMKPKENAIWINVYKNKEGHLFITGVEYPNEESAKESADEFGYLKTLRITDKPDTI